MCPTMRMPLGCFLLCTSTPCQHGTSSMGGLASPSDHWKEGRQGAMATAVKPRLCYTKFRGEAGSLYDA